MPLVCRVIQGDQRSAALHEPLEARRTLRPNPTGVLLRHGSGKMTRENSSRVLVGQDYGVKSRQVAGAKVGVGNRREVELVVLQKPAGPARISALPEITVRGGAYVARPAGQRPTGRG